MLMALSGDVVDMGYDTQDKYAELVVQDRLRPERDFINELNAIAQATRKYLLVHHARKQAVTGIIRACP